MENNKEAISENNDKNKFEEIKPQKKEVRIDSYFDGSLIELIGWKLLAFLITIVTFGIGAPWGACMIYAYQINHTVYNGKRLKFEGTGGELFVNIFKWILFSIITLGIYTFFIPVRKTKWVISKIHFETEQFTNDESFFDGKTIQLICVNIICKILNFISLGLLSAFTFCYKTNWIIKHTVINRKKLAFTGRAISLFGHCMLWGFLTVITFGIFGLWVPIKMLKWQNKNIHIKLLGEEEPKDKSLYIAIPILIIGIILFVSIIGSAIPTIKNSNKFEEFNIEEIFENFEDCINGRSIEDRKTNDKSVRLINENQANIGSEENNPTITEEGNENIQEENLTNKPNDKVSNEEYLKFVGTYIDVFESPSTLIINKNGKVTISRRVIASNLSNLKKQSDGSYKSSISGGTITIYPVGIASPQGDNSKVRVEVEEAGGALAFQEK